VRQTGLRVHLSRCREPRRAAEQRERPQAASDDFVSITIALSVTTFFLGISFARWPSPFRLNTFQIEHVDLLGSLYSHPHERIRIANN
jgi:hypothetical protein